MEFVLIGVIVVVVLMLWSALEKKFNALETRLGRMERLQLRLAEHQGMAPVRPDLEPVHALLVARKRIAAIKEYREITGASLAESKAAVERIDRGEQS